MCTNYRMFPSVGTYIVNWDITQIESGPFAGLAFFVVNSVGGHISKQRGYTPGQLALFKFELLMSDVARRMCKDSMGNVFGIPSARHKAPTKPRRFFLPSLQRDHFHRSHTKASFPPSYRNVDFWWVQILVRWARLFDFPHPINDWAV